MSLLYSLFGALRDVVLVALNLYVWVLIFGAVASWLIAFEILNTRNRFVQSLLMFCDRLTEPALRPIRRFLPPMSGIDLSPVILILGVLFLQQFLLRL